MKKIIKKQYEFNDVELLEKFGIKGSIERFEKNWDSSAEEWTFKVFTEEQEEVE